MTAYKLTQDISPHIFRAYDIRGVVGETLTLDAVYTLGLAIGSLVLKAGEKTLLTARDGRNSGPALLTALQQGLLASGCDVVDLGPVPTPLLYFATHCLPFHSGIMVTGSHNPANYNGLKIVINKLSLTEQTIAQLYQMIVEQDFCYGQGNLASYSIVAEYKKFILQDITLIRPMKVVIDAGNGIAGNIASCLLKQLGCEIIELYCEVDGYFPNHQPDPSQPENLQQLIRCVEQHQADLGIAFDGDGDRLGVVTNKGEIIWPDRLLMLYSQDILSRHPKAKIVFDIKCSQHLLDFIAKQGGIPIQWKTGHSFIKQKLKEIGASLGGEMSGHIFFEERWFGFDDGIYAAARLMEILARTSCDVASTFHGLPNSLSTPELKLSIAEENKFTLMQTILANLKFAGSRLTTIDGLRADFRDGWGLIRSSNTSPYLTLRFEAHDQDALLRIQSLFREQLLAIDPKLNLPF